MRTQIYNIATHPQKLKGLKVPSGAQYQMTRHAQERWDEKVDVPAFLLDASEGTIVEMEMVGKSVTKLVVRIPTGTENDVVVVLRPEGARRFVILTVWVNHVNDTHKTLDKSRVTTRGVA